MQIKATFLPREKFDTIELYGIQAVKTGHPVRNVLTMLTPLNMCNMCTSINLYN